MRGIGAYHWDERYGCYKIYLLKEGKYRPDYNGLENTAHRHSEPRPKTEDELMKITEKYFYDYLFVPKDVFLAEVVRRKSLIENEFTYKVLTKK